MQRTKQQALWMENPEQNEFPSDGHEAGYSRH